MPKVAREAAKQQVRTTQKRIFEAAKHVQKVMKSNINTETRTLRNSVAIKRKTKLAQSTSYAVVGPKRRVRKLVARWKFDSPRFRLRPKKIANWMVPTKYAHLLDGGAKAHPVPVTRGIFAGYTLRHPGMKGTKFIERTSKQTKGAVTRIVSGAGKDLENAIRSP